MDFPCSNKIIVPQIFDAYDILYVLDGNFYDYMPNYYALIRTLQKNTTFESK